MMPRQMPLSAMPDTPRRALRAFTPAGYAAEFRLVMPADFCRSAPAAALPSPQLLPPRWPLLPPPAARRPPPRLMAAPPPSADASMRMLMSPPPMSFRASYRRRLSRRHAAPPPR